MALTWERKLELSQHDVPRAIQTTSEGYIYIAGTTLGNPSSGNKNSYDGFISKFKDDGTLIWSTIFDTSRFDRITTSTIDKDGGVILAGTTSGDIDNSDNNGSIDIFIAKYSGEGVRDWAHCLAPTQEIVPIQYYPLLTETYMC